MDGGPGYGPKKMSKKVNICFTAEPMKGDIAHPVNRPLTQLDLFRRHGLTFEGILGRRQAKVGRSEPTLFLRANNLIFPGFQ